jgi:hypothetical protein
MPDPGPRPTRSRGRVDPAGGRSRPSVSWTTCSAALAFGRAFARGFAFGFAFGLALAFAFAFAFALAIAYPFTGVTFTR